MDNTNLKKAGLKVTLPRTRILEILENTKDRHLRAEDVYQILREAGDDVGLATVYRVLTQFEEAGLVRRHHFEGEHSVFELDDGAHHDHLVCVKCNKIEEFIDAVIEERQQAVAKQAGFNLIDHSLNMYGICKECQLVE